MDILATKQNHILTIEFNRPDKKNAITNEMYLAMVNALADAESDVSVRAILIVGKPEVFTAGNDLEEFVKDPPSDPDYPVFQFMQAITHATKPVVASVSGLAVGIGTTLLLHCDLVYAADNAKFILPFSQLGLCPELASSYVLPQIAGYQRAAEKLMLGEAFSAEEACAMGFVNKVLPLEQVTAYAQTQAAKLAALPASSVRATKRLMRAPHMAAIEAQMANENKTFGGMLSAPEAQEAFAAFLGKRKADFTKFS